jgi:predicted DNA-binding protein YlxM (UPF0122 family)
MKHLDLFAGIGGFSLAASWVWPDHEPVGFCEIDPFCQKVLKKHWPGVPVYDDIKKLTGEGLGIMGAPRNPQYDEAVSLYESGLSVQETADKFGITRQAMWGILKRRGAKFRPREKRGEDNHFYRGGEIASSRAQDILEAAIRRGDIKRQETCEACGDSPIYKDGRSGVQAHHADYNKPLEVEWLCQQCHHEWHQNNTARALTEDLPKMTRKEICSLGGKTKKSNRKGDPELSGGYEGSTTVDLLTGGFP